ncbi:putative AT-hook motif nuclear-localized protein 17-like [Iris pallida]|uniref:AT-hook motif nuclear-localized protein n=1 Tax=Iris pallida TaxID=29817 RepID=A0AAX6DJC5_IRIPA|nr:putative AT-hook motif nuclear-localized protein 17-like [Iris pallida]
MILSSSFMEPDVAKKQKHPHSDVDNKLVPFAGGGGGDGSSIEVAKRPRGRPPGSKNRPKPPVIITRESEPASAMRPHVLEIAPGCDVVDSLSAFSRRKSLGVCVLAATGTVSNVTLRQPPHPSAAAVPPPPAGTVGFRGRFEVLSMSATFFPPEMRPAPGGAVTISLAGPGGQVVGGTVVGPLVAAGTVTVVAAGFENPTFLRLPVAAEEEDVSVSVSAGGGEGSAEGYGQPREFHRQQQRRDHDDDAAAAAVSAHRESGAMAMYSSAHFPAETIWAPAGRPPHPPPY